MKLTRVFTLALRSVPVFVLCASLTACASGRAYENLGNWMQEQIGKSAEDPDAYRNRYRNLHVAAKELPNGNVEEQYRTGRGLRCQVYFEIDKATRKIVGWRYGGTQEDCVLIP
jgi:hypothetical protein